MKNSVQKKEACISKHRTYMVLIDDYITDVIVKYEEYETTSTLAVCLYEKDFELCEWMDDSVEPDGQDAYTELFAVLTVNLPDSDLLPWNTQYVDTNNYPWAVGWLIENELAKPTGTYAESGYCVYPAMRFICAERPSNQEEL